MARQSYNTKHWPVGSGETLEAEDLEEMGLTFCFLKGGAVHDLIPSGRNIPVTLPRVREFIRLAKAKHAELGGS